MVAMRPGQCHSEEFGNSSKAVLLPQSLWQKKLQGKEYFCNFTNLKKI